MRTQSCAIAAVLALALMLVGCAPMTSTPSAPSSASSFAPGVASPLTEPFKSAFERLNFYRTSIGLPAVQYDAKLADGARHHSQYLVMNNIAGGNAIISDGQVRMLWAESRVNPLNYLARMHAGAETPPEKVPWLWAKSGVNAESPGNQWYSEAGESVALYSVVIRSKGPIPLAGNAIVDQLMTMPFLGLVMLDPQLGLMGNGEFCQESDCASTTAYRLGLEKDVFTQLYESDSGLMFNPALGRMPFMRARLRTAVEFPSERAAAQAASYSGEDIPDPLTSCPGYSAPTGAPIFLQLGAPNEGESAVKVSEHSLSEDGVAMESCAIDATTYSNRDGSHQDQGRRRLGALGAAILLPRKPLKPGHSYSVSITVDAHPYQWTFRVAPDAK